MYLLPAGIKGSKKWCFGQASPILKSTELNAAAAFDKHLHVLITEVTRIAGDLHAFCEYTVSNLQSGRYSDQLCSLTCTTLPFAHKVALMTQVCISSSDHTVEPHVQHPNADAIVAWSASVELVKFRSAGVSEPIIAPALHLQAVSHVQRQRLELPLRRTAAPAALAAGSQRTPCHSLGQEIY